VRAAQSDLTSSQEALSATAPKLAAATTIQTGAIEPLLTIHRDQIKAAAARERADLARRQQAQARTAARLYSEQIDRLLRNSAETRGDLGGLVTGVQNGTIGPEEASTQIDRIVLQRQDLQNAVAAVSAPPAFRDVADLLRDSIRAALDDDLALQRAFHAWREGDPSAIDAAWVEHQQATQRASAAKQTFVTAYERVRSRFGLGPFGTGTSY
jgi:hypothetical protein